MYATKIHMWLAVHLPIHLSPSQQCPMISSAHTIKQSNGKKITELGQTLQNQQQHLMNQISSIF